MHNAAELESGVTKLVPGASANLAHLTDSELLTNTRALVGRSNHVFAALLAHLAEVEARGLHRSRACSSLYTYCIYELRFSEDAAARRAGAAKLVKRFPLVLECIANGELHLTGLLMLGPHLTPENVVQVLARAKFRTKKELGQLVRELHPLPLIPDSIEPLGRELRTLRAPTWAQYVSSCAPAVRELRPGERPRDWANDADTSDVEASHAETNDVGTSDVDPAAVGSASALPALARVNELRAELPPITAPQQYQMQFSTTEQHVKLVERAKALLARGAPSKSLGQLHLDAMKLLVASLEKQRFAVTDRPRRRAETSPRSSGPTAIAGEETAASSETTASEATAALESPRRNTASRRRSRHIPAAIRRAVFERDAGRCTYVDARGERCRETHSLELHHREPFGKHGEHCTDNLTLHCRSHNALAAERDFGATHMTEKRNAARHESLASEQRRARRAFEED
jgi:5-methylcytosine-specific restriction endonuclease McrA